jgi:hypothetical protein
MSGTLFGVDAGGAQLITINPMTGMATAVGPLLASGGFSGLTFVPEPGTGLLVAGGLMAIAWHRRSPKSAARRVLACDKASSRPPPAGRARPAKS